MNELHTPEEATMLAELREIYEAVPAETAKKWGPEGKYDQGPAVRFLIGLVDKHVESRQYGRDIINDMTLEAEQAKQQVTDLQARVVAYEKMVQGVSLVWVSPSTTTNQPGYYTPILSAMPPVDYSLAHGGTTNSISTMQEGGEAK